MNAQIKNFVLAALLAMCVFGMTAFSVILGINAQTTPVSTLGAQETDFMSYASPLPATDKFSSVSGNSFNILLVGLDWQPSKYSDYPPQIEKQLLSADGESADTGTGNVGGDTYRKVNTLFCVLVRVDKERGEVTFTALPRDMIMQSGGETISFGSLYEKYGRNYFIRRAEVVTGIKADKYAVVAADELVRLVDMLGGIEYNLPVTMNFGGYTVNAGNNLVNGQTALSILMYDGYKDAQYTKESTAQTLIEAFIKGLFSDGGDRTGEKFKQISGCLLATDITEADIGENSAVITASAAFEYKSLNIKGVYQIYGENRYFILDITETLEYFAGYRKIYR